MKERPILFSGPMVRALLDGRKSQTRRVMKRQPPATIEEGYSPKVYWPSRDTHMSTAPHQPAYVQFERRGEYDGCHIMKDGFGFYCPYGQPGDRLRVRETWAQPTTLDPGPTFYRADYPACVPSGFENVPRAGEITWKPSIHMPRAMSRLTLEVTGVRVERLQSVSESDAAAEGIESLRDEGEYWKDYVRSTEHCDELVCLSARESFQTLWDSINGTESWNANPWVWVVEFRRVGDEIRRPREPSFNSCPAALLK